MPHGGSLGEAIKRLEDCARRDPGKRGLSSRAPAGRLGPAAFELLKGRRVALLTGFCVRSAMIGETDGPPGVLALASALRVLGKKLVLISDRHSLPLLKAGFHQLKSHFRTLELPDSQEETDSILDAFVSSFKPTHVLALERPGSAPDGHRYSMRGEILDDIAPAADRLFAGSRDRGYVTLAVGDGGNELGMGALRKELSGGVPLGDKIFCSVPADYALACGVSNWGGYALAAALSLLSGIMLLRTVEREREILDALFEAGAVDGCTKKACASVDGLSWEEYSETLRAIYDLTAKTLEDRKARPETGRDA